MISDDIDKINENLKLLKRSLKMPLKQFKKCKIYPFYNVKMVIYL